MYGQRRGAYRVLVEKTERERPLGLPRCRCKNDIKVKLQEVESEGMDWIYLAQERNMWRAIVNEVIKIPVP